MSAIDPRLAELIETLEIAASRKQFRRIDFFEPYDKQREFFDAGLTHRERLLMAGNQLGKSEAGAYEVACHLTGEYPDWWLGRRFNHPVTAWAAGETGLVVRDVQQAKLCGKPGVEGSLGTGLIPKESFVDKPSLARGVTDAYDTIQVRHKSGGISTLSFKSYEQGRTKFQGATLDFVWLDEECPLDIYGECLTRTTATAGFVFTTFTPLKGRTAVVLKFLEEENPDRAYINMTIMDVPLTHFLAVGETGRTDAELIERRARIIAGYPAHERDARVRGIPILGSGRVFTTAEETLAEPTLTYIPPHWCKLWGIDFGIGHPFAAALIAWDKDNDVIHILNGIRIKDGLPINHAAAIKPIGAAVPIAWPHDGTQRDKGSGESLAPQYRKHGLKMLDTHATWPDGGYSTEAGILEMRERMESGRLKVAAQLAPWFEEYRLYHRKDGIIIKVQDDLLSATRIAIMMKRYARAVPLGSKTLNRLGPADNMASDVNLSARDLF